MAVAGGGRRWRIRAKNGHVEASVAAAGVAAITVAAFVTGRWVLTAIPVGALFGFFLQKGDLCGASALSEVVLTRDGRKLWGLWVAIVVSMLGIALGDQLGWIQLNPKPFMWASAVVGGVVFGAGMVLAGGCVSGCLYKGATSWLARLGQIRIPAGDGGPVTFSSLTGLPFWALAVILAGATLMWAFLRRGSTTAARPAPATDASRGVRLHRPWKAWQAGIAIGLLTLPAYVS